MSDNEKTQCEYGLSDAEVEERIAAHADNCKVESSTQSISDIVKSNVLTYFNLVFLILAILLGIVRAWSDMLFIPVIAANTCIGIVQEIHSKKVLDRLSIVSAPKIKTLRNGKIQILSSEELVRDDICIFEAGSQIPADAVVLEGNASLNEALITGEADEVAKEAGDELLSGSYVVSGSLKAKLEKVGAEAFASKLTIEATRTHKKEQSEMIRSLNKLIIMIGITIIPIGIMIFVQSFVNMGRNLKDSITGMAAAVIGMIPEGLYLLSSLALAVSTIRLAADKVLVHDMKCIETLARVDVLCVDKTGTITEPEMEVCGYIVYDGETNIIEQEEFALPPNTADKNGTDENEIDESSAEKCNMIKGLLENYILCMHDDNATMKALKRFVENSCQTAQSDIAENTQAHIQKNTNEISGIQPFSPEKKYSKATINGETCYLGAPEIVMAEAYSKIERDVTAYTEQGHRTLVFAKENHMPLILIALSNPIRKGAGEIFDYFNDNDVAVKVISGDNPEMVSRIAEAANIKDADKYTDTSDLETPEDYKNAVSQYTVFGRVRPEQKKQLVSALKNEGHIVAMTGDGVNDVLALKDADCGIAMASGSDAACHVSQLVLMDSDFSKMKHVIDEGRRVVNNIERSASLFLVKNIFSMLLAVFCVIFIVEYPLKPVQVSIISMYTIGIPAFILALEPNNNPIRGSFLKKIIKRSLPVGIGGFMAVSGLIIFGGFAGLSADRLSRLCLILVSLIGFEALYRAMKTETKIKQGYIIMLICLALGLYITFILFEKAFG
ncbi:MAG: cation-translocating P-type ATPase [Lachnobacterium sp.]|nr:cation-translocating P-type ATPase [Lachnobacterium sp.]